MNYITNEKIIKVCNGCKRELPANVAYFRRHSQTKDGLRNPCKECMGHNFSIERTKGSLTANEGYKLCKGCLQEFPSNNLYFQDEKRTNDGLTGKCKICIKEDIKKKPSRSKKYLKDYNKKYYLENKEFIVVKQAEYIEKNKEKIWFKKRAYSQKRRAKMKKLDNTLTFKEWESILERFDYRCAYCYSDEYLEQEHFIPVKKNGGYTKENIIPACRSCNASKRDNDFYSWYKEYKHYSIERENKILETLKK